MILKLPLLLLFFGISCAIANPNVNRGHQGNKQGQGVQGGHHHGRQTENNPNEGPKGPPKPYIFSYGVHGDKQGGNFGQHEESDGKTVKGSYIVNLPDGRQQVVSYTAGKDGFQADVKYVGEAQYPTATHKPDHQANQNDLIKGGHKGSYSNQGTQSGHQIPEDQHNHHANRVHPHHAGQETNLVHANRANSQPVNPQLRHHGITSFQNQRFIKVSPDKVPHQHQTQPGVHLQQRQQEDYPPVRHEATHVHHGHQAGNPHLSNKFSNHQGDYLHHNHHANPRQSQTDHQGHQTYRNNKQSSPHHGHQGKHQHEITHPHQGISPNQPRRSTNNNHHNHRASHPNQADQNSHEQQRQNNNFKPQSDNNRKSKHSFGGNEGPQDSHDNYEDHQHRPVHGNDYSDAQNVRGTGNKHHQAEGTQVRGNSETQNKEGNQRQNNDGEQRSHQERERDHSHKQGQSHNNNHKNDEQGDGHNDHEENNRHNQNQEQGHDDRGEEHDLKHENHRHDHKQDHDDDRGQEHDHGHGHGQEHGNRNDFGDASDHRESSSGNDDHSFGNNDFFRAPEGFGKDKFGFH